MALGGQAVREATDLLLARRERPSGCRYDVCHALVFDMASRETRTGEYNAHTITPGNEAISTAKPKLTENSSASSGGTPCAPSRDVTASSRKPHPPIEIGSNEIAT